MNLTPQQLRDRADAIEAHEAGRPVERLFNGVIWTLTNREPSQWPADMPYRPAPAPEPPKSWDCEADVPGPVCWLRKSHDSIVYLVYRIETYGVSISTGFITWPSLKAQVWDYSTDRKTWKPCVKEAK